MMGGLAYMTGPPGRPLRAGTSVNDIMGGMFAAIGILAALHERARTGKGQMVRSALFENNVFLVAQHMAQFAVTGKPAPPMPARISAWGIYDVFDTGMAIRSFSASSPTRNGRCSAGLRAARISSPIRRSRTNPQRVAARDRLLPILRELFLRFSARRDHRGFREGAASLRADHEARGSVRRSASRDARRHGRGHEAGGDTMPRSPRLPLEMAGRRLGRRLDVPRLGEHSASIAAELGYGQELIEDWWRTGFSASRMRRGASLHPRRRLKAEGRERGCAPAFGARVFCRAGRLWRPALSR